MDAKGLRGDSFYAFNRRKGFGLEYILQSVFEWHISQGTLTKIFNIDCKSLNICMLSYEGNTGADLLMIEEPASNEDLAQDKKLQAYIFNVKTKAKSLLGEFGSESRRKFDALCERFATKYNVTLCLMVSDTDNLEQEILGQWSPPENHCYKLYPKLLCLQDLADVAPEIEVSAVEKYGIDSTKFVVARSFEKLQLMTGLSHVATNVFVQGRYRVGKTTILRQMSVENQPSWRYFELPVDMNRI